MRKIFFILLIVFPSLHLFCQEGDQPYQETDGIEPIYDLKDVQEQPEFPGGAIALSQFIEKNIRYPEEEKKKRIQGNVFVTFVIDKDGRATNIEISKAVKDGPGLSREAWRIMQSLPQWKPGMQNGKPVKVNSFIPFSFRLDSPASAPTMDHSPQR